MTYECGCENEIHEASGVLHCVKKCEYHKTWSLLHSNNSLAYYESTGALINGIPQNIKYIAELKDVLADLDFKFDGQKKNLFEIGCGLGMYVPFFLRHGFNYLGIDTSQIAGYWVMSTFDVRVWNMDFEIFNGENFDLIFSAHTFEHLDFAPRQLERVHDKLNPGGYLFLIVPDDSDPVNPDHKWFFRVETLTPLLDKIGFKNIRTTVRKVIARENFIYCVAQK